MKRIIFSLLVVAAAGFSLSTCQKEESAAARPGVTETTGKRAPLIYLTGNATSSCGNSYPCQISNGLPYRVNRLNVTKDGPTATNYPSLRYSFYKKGTEVSPGQFEYTRISQSVCNENPVRLANSAITNATRFFVLANDPASAAPGTTLYLYQEDYIINFDSAWGSTGHVFITSGSFYGISCVL